MNKQYQNNNTADRILKDAFVKAASDSFESIPAEGDIDLAFSNDFFEKAVKEERKNKKAFKNFINTASKRAAVIAVIVLLSFSSLLTVDAIREPFFEFIKETYQKASRVFTKSDVEEETTNDEETDQDDTYDTFSTYGEEIALSLPKETEIALDPNEEKTENADSTKGEKAQTVVVPPVNNSSIAPACQKHIWAEYKTVAPTCTEKGYTQYKCTVCGATYDDDYTEAVGHKYQMTNRVLPTCEEEGVNTYTCTECGDKYNETVKRKTHNWALLETVRVCGKPLEGHFICVKCHKIEIEYKGICGHILTAVEHVSPTCTKDGYTEYKCTVCGETVTKINSSDKRSGHKTYEKIVASTCTESAYVDLICTRCGELIEHKVTAGPRGHDLFDNVEEPTCTEQGYSYPACSRCDYLVIHEYIPETGHQMVERIIDPTCFDDGYSIQECLRCRMKSGDKYNVTPALGHDYIESKRIDPTCQTKGRVTYTCSRCGDTYSEALAITDHDFSKYLYTYAPGCTRQGYKLYQCLYCNATNKTDFVPAYGHVFSPDKVIAPTESEDGYTIYKCTVCGATEKRDFVPKTNNNE
ncbi:MAG: hypothetical protein IJT70_00300 [Clostridia bacterium]|nr:hypothetical protein [Clostridia bacterium]